MAYPDQHWLSIGAACGIVEDGVGRIRSLNNRQLPFHVKRSNACGIRASAQALVWPTPYR